MLTFRTHMTFAIIVAASAAFAAEPSPPRAYYRLLNVEPYGAMNFDVAKINNAGQLVGTMAEPDDYLGRQPYLTNVPGTQFQNFNDQGYVTMFIADLNDAGVVAGSAVRDNRGVLEHTLVRYTPGVGMEDLGTLDGSDGFAFATNNHGDVVGYWHVLGGPYNGIRAFLYTDAGGLQNLGTLGGHASIAVDINDSRQVVGSARVGPPVDRERAFVWENGVMTPLGPSDKWSGASAINNAGIVVGSYIDYDHDYLNRPFMYDTHTHVTTPIPLPDGHVGGTATLINELGQIAGASYLYTPGQGSVALPGAPVALNNKGHVVGNIQVGYIHVPYFWTPESGGIVLDDVVVPPLPWVISTVVALNDADEIVVTGVYHGVQVAAVLFGPKVADMNCDAQVTFGDIDPFVLALSGQATYEAALPFCNWSSADVNHDGAVNFRDIDAFVAVLAGE